MMSRNQDTYDHSLNGTLFGTKAFILFSQNPSNQLWTTPKTCP